MKWFLTILFMAQVANIDVVDADESFTRVDTRTPAHKLPAGVAADAVNKRIENGEFWPRLSVQQQPWGQVHDGGNVVGYKKFSDPNGQDVTVYLSDDWRDGNGEDGGRGRAWRVQSGNAPVAVPMNGHDIYGVARIVPAKNAVVMLRQDLERHYFSGANNPVVAAGVIQLNCAPAWKDGDALEIWFDASVNSALTGGTVVPGASSLVFAKDNGNNQVKLYKDSQLTQAFNFTGAVGRFYLERRAANPGFYGNGAPPLIAQPNAQGNTLWETGFVSVPVNVVATAIDGTNKILTAPNHRLVPGDKIQYYHAGAGAPYYAVPLNDNQIIVFDTQTNALLNFATGSATGQQTLLFTAADYLVKDGASDLPAPPAREGYYTQNSRLVLVNQKNNIWISDPNDPLHGTPFQSSFTANLGEADSVVWVNEIASADALVFGKQRCVLALYNFSGGPSQWALRSITREYGSVAAFSVQWGNMLLFLSRRGLDRVVMTVFGVIGATENPVSYDMKKYIGLIDWNNAATACCETWNNRLFLGLPSLNSGGLNDMVLSLNFEYSAPEKEVWGWEGMWNGAALKVFSFARHVVYGVEKLTFADYAGNVNWLDEGAMDTGNAAIADSVTTRIYTGVEVPATTRKIWQRCLLNWDTCAPSLTITAATPGYNETDVLAQGFTYDRTKYAAGEGADYNPQTQVPPFGNPYREDYSFASALELMGGVPDVHQNHVEPFRMREDDWGLQLTIANSQGSCRLKGVDVRGFLGPNSERIV